MNEIDGVACGTAGCDNRGHPGLNLVGYGSFASEVRSTAAVPGMHSLQVSGTLITNTAPTAYSGPRCTRRSVRPRSKLTRRRREHFCDRQGVRAIPATPSRAGSSGPRRPQGASTTGCCEISTSLSCRLMSSARSSARRARPAGCLRPSRYRPACGLVASWATSPIASARAVISDVIRRGRVVGCPLIATDGFEYYVGAVEGRFAVNVRLWSSPQECGGTIVSSGSSAA